MKQIAANEWMFFPRIHWFPRSIYFDGLNLGAAGLCDIHDQTRRGERLKRCSGAYVMHPPCRVMFKLVLNQCSYVVTLIIISQH